jgi:hypothetical protein
MPILYNVGNKLTAGSEPPQLYRYQDRVLGDGGTLETRDEASTFIRRLRSAGVLGSTVLAGVAGGYKAGKLYSIIGPDLDVTRGTVKNRVNRAGVLSEVASGVPATTYAGGVLRGTTVEPSAVQLATDLRKMITTWTPTNITVGDAVGWDGGATSGSLLTATDANGTILQTFTGASAQRTYSVALRRVTGTGTIEITANGGATWVNVTSLLGANYLVVSATATELNPQFGIRMATSGDVIAADYNQFEAGAVATSRITTSPRNADVISKTGLGSVLPQTEGWVYAEVDTRVLGNTGAGRRIISLSDGTNDNRIEIIKAITDGITYFVVSGTSVVVNATFSSNLSGKLKIIGSYQLNNFNLYINGTKVITDTSATVPTLSNVNLGASVGGGLLFNDTIHSIAIGSGPITDASAIQLTTL